MADLPGHMAKHVVITPACIVNRGKHGAVEAALEQARSELHECIDGWQGRDQGHRVNFRLGVTVERLEESS